MGDDFFWPGWRGIDGLVVSMSAGRDSTAAASVAKAVADAAGVEVVGVFVDNDAGWPGAWQYVQRVGGVLGLPVVREYTKRTLLQDVRRRGRWPGPRTRYCTSAKREAIERIVRFFWGRQDRVWHLVVVSGERMEESPRRRRLRPWSLDKRLTGRGEVRIVWRWRPVLRWGLDEVRGQVERLGLEEFEAYRYVSRTACLFCPFARPAEWRAQARRFPLLAKVWLEVEEEIGHWLSADVSLREAVRNVEELRPYLYPRWLPGRRRGPLLVL